uniref:Protein disulfide-isomerase n=1 Tax=Ciona intestinalis TaxID=7719 RepID=F6WYW5_CIOIN
ILLVRWYNTFKMKHLFIALSALCVAIVSAADDVLVLTDSNFDAEIVKHSIILMEFYAPWCGHCKKLAPEYDIAATKLKRNDPPIRIGKVDCTENTATCSKFGVSGYPTLKLFADGKLSKDYDGPRQADGIVKYMQKAASPAAVLIETAAAHDKLLQKSSSVVVVGYFTDKAKATAFENVAKTLRDDYKFAYTTSDDVMDAAGEKDTVKMYRPQAMANKFEESTMVIAGEPTVDGYRTFLNENALGRCGLLTTDNYGKFKKPLVILAGSDVDYVKNIKGSNYWRNRVVKFGKEFKEQLTFGIANKDGIVGLLPESGLPEDVSPVVVIVDAQDRKYVMPNAFSSKDNFVAFLTSYTNGELSPFIKSEEPPADNDGPVTVVTGKTFDEIVMDESKDVLIEFYAPWCGHCKSLEPKWNELGEKMKDNNDIVIAKIDATANDSPSQFQVSGFPTIYFAPKGNKQNPVKYQGGREVADFSKYLKENASKGKSEL